MTAPEQRTSLWGGRFEGGPAEALARLSVSVHFDWRLAPYDLQGSRAHARVLHRAGLLDDGELERMLGALDQLGVEVADGTFRPRVEDEDVQVEIAPNTVIRVVRSQISEVRGPKAAAPANDAKKP